MTTAIQVSNLAKLYRLGEVGTGSLAHDFNRWWHKLRGKGDPYARIGEANDRTTKGETDYVWALKDVSFDIQQGEVVGIIGRNGAGKSTLLKILSRVTSPTSGSIKAKGRIASLLEVGTGFHPELTGRENIYLNGAILGMRKHEITRKLDEIIDFSGCERYIDTPVKRYSSGMYVRLAFAVAAHLEPEIMVIDEVLAVGDGDFQKKCLGKMRSMHDQGRTVIIVSHQMTMITSLCDRGIVMKNGSVDFVGPAAESVLRYQPAGQSDGRSVFVAPDTAKPVGDDKAELHRAWVADVTGRVCPAFDLTEPVFIYMNFTVHRELANRFYPNLHVFDERGEYIFCTAANLTQLSHFANRPGTYSASCEIPGNLLNAGTYSVSVAVTCMDPGVTVPFFEKDALAFQVIEDINATLDHNRHGYAGPMPGPIRPSLNWSIRPCTLPDLKA